MSNLGITFSGVAAPLAGLASDNTTNVAIVVGCWLVAVIVVCARDVLIEKIKAEKPEAPR